MTITFIVNGTARTVDVDADTPLLWVLRDTMGLQGTKFGCGLGACGACTVHLDGEAVRSCTLPAGAAAGREVTTVEGLGDGDEPHPVQQAWIEEIVPQCGYCQPGFMMSAAALLARVPDPSDDDIDAYVDNVCRCGTYVRMRRAIHRAAELASRRSERAP